MNAAIRTRAAPSGVPILAAARPGGARHRRRAGVLLLTVLALGGCKKELYTGLSEKQANTMLSALLGGGIDTAKKADPKDTFSILVDQSDLAAAVDLLNDVGLPGDDFVDMAKMYEKEGLISSPMEERVRYTFALSQSIAETLTNIDGVLTARVHIALPEKDGFTGVLEPSSASVFIKHRSDHRLDDIRSEIKRIVESSIEGLSYDRIAVFMSAAATPSRRVSESTGEALVAYGPFTMKRESVTLVKSVLLTVLVVIVSLAAAVAWLGWKLGVGGALLGRVRRLRDRRGEAVDGDLVPGGGETEPAGAASRRLRSIATFRKSA